MSVTTKKTVTKKVSTSYSSSSATSYSVKKTTSSGAPIGGLNTSTISIRSSQDNFTDTTGREMGINFDDYVKQIKSNMETEMEQLKAEAYHLLPLTKPGSNNEIVKINETSMKDYMDKVNNDNLKFNFDVHDYSAESISVKAVGNKIEVHAKKKSLKGGEEDSEEFSTTYELPGGLDSSKVTSQVFKDGVLTVELPMNAIEQKKD